MTFLNITDELNYQQLKFEVNQRLQDLVLREGYLYVEPNFFEDYEAFVLTNKRVKKERMVKMLDNDGRILVLRPDITTSLMRQIIPKWRGQSELKLFYHSTIFSRSNQGLIEPIRQFGLEYLGSNDKDADVTVINLASKLFHAFSVPYMLEISDTRFLDGIIEMIGLKDRESSEIKDIFYRKSTYDLTEFIAGKVKDDAHKNLLSKVFSLQGDIKRIQTLIEGSLLPMKSKEALTSLINVVSQLDDKACYMVDLSLVSTYDYYEGILFKGYLHGSQKEVLSGGRYDPLTENFGKKTHAIGFTLDTQELINEVLNYEG